MNVKSLTTRYLITGIILFSLCQLSYPQFVDFNTIQKSGTVLINAHMDDDLIWMLPFWDISEKFILGAMPRTPVYEAIVHGQQGLIDGLGYNIDYEANWITPWGGITAEEYHEYYDLGNLNYSYLANDHLIAFWNLTQDTETDRKEINRIKSKLEQYIASPDLSRIITHNNWGEYGNQHHKALNKAVRELAVKYRKDVWMLGCDNGTFIDVDVPDGIKYTLASFDDPALYTGIRSIYYNYEWHWTWDDYLIPSGNHKFIKIVEAGIDKSDILPPVQEVDVPGPLQEEPGAYIFDGEDDYMTLTGNNFSSFTIAMRVRPDQISSMDIAKMAEFPYYGSNDYFQPLPSLFDRSFYLQNNGRVNARIFDGSSKIASSTTALTSGNWAHLAMTSDGSNLKIYINGIPENTVSAGTAITGYASPEFVLGQAQETSHFFEGQISDVRLYDYVLTDSEIADLSGPFPPRVYTITSGAGTGGTISPMGNILVNQGENKTFDINANSGYQILNVLVDNISEGAVSTYTFNNITTNHSIAATFSSISGMTYTISASAGTGGSINPSGTVTVNEGADQSFSITTYSDFQISDVLVDDISVGAVSTYTFTNITSDHTIEATFYSLSPNIALNKPTTCQSFEDTSESSYANDDDGTNNSFWGADPYPQWWKVDLQNSYDLTSIVVRNYVDGTRYYHYNIEISNDDINYQQIAEKVNNDPAIDAGIIYNVNVTARYIKVNMMYNSANTGVHISDFRAYGTIISAWTGTENSDWTDHRNWSSNVVPASTDDITILHDVPNYPVITSSLVECNNLIIESGAILTVNAGKAFSVSGNLFNSGTLYLKSDATGIASLKVDGNSPVTGNNNIQLFLTGGAGTSEDAYKWHYISSPVDNTNISVFDGHTTNLATYDESLVSISQNDGWMAVDGYIYKYLNGEPYGTGFLELSLGKGYAYYFISDQTYTITGTINTDQVTVPLGYHSGPSGNVNIWGFNLIGNPFTCTLDWDVVADYNDLDETTDISSAIYFTKDYNTIPTYSPEWGGTDGGTNLIPPMQAFFVDARAGGHSIILPVDAKTHSGTTRFKGEKKSVSLVRLLLEKGEIRRDLIVGFNEKAVLSFDSRFDAYSLGKGLGPISIWTNLNGIDYAINGIPYPETSIDIPVGIHTETAGTFSLYSNELSGLENYSVTLKDNSTNNVLDLKTGNKLSFFTSAGEFEDRFVLTITNSTSPIEDTLPEEAFNVYSFHGMLNINPLSDNWDGKSGSIRIINITGRNMTDNRNIEFHKNSIIQLPVSLSAGIYMVEIRSGTMRYIQKVIFR